MIITAVMMAMATSLETTSEQQENIACSGKRRCMHQLEKLVPLWQRYVSLDNHHRHDQQEGVRGQGMNETRSI